MFFFLFFLLKLNMFFCLLLFIFFSKPLWWSQANSHSIERKQTQRRELWRCKDRRRPSGDKDHRDSSGTTGSWAEKSVTTKEKKTDVTIIETVQWLPPRQQWNVAHLMEDVATVDGWRFLQRWIHLPLKYLLVVASVLCFRLIEEGDAEEDHQALEVHKTLDIYIQWMHILLLY